MECSINICNFPFANSQWSYDIVRFLKGEISINPTQYLHIASEESHNKYESLIKPLATFETVEDFWAVYQHCKRPEAVETKTCYHLFQEGIKPMWEDENNEKGGRWHVWLPKG